MAPHNKPSTLRVPMSPMADLFSVTASMPPDLPAITPKSEAHPVICCPPTPCKPKWIPVKRKAPATPLRRFCMLSNSDQQLLFGSHLPNMSKHHHIEKKPNKPSTLRVPVSPMADLFSVAASMPPDFPAITPKSEAHPVICCPPTPCKPKWIPLKRKVPATPLQGFCILSNSDQQSLFGSHLPNMKHQLHMEKKPRTGETSPPKMSAKEEKSRSDEEFNVETKSLCGEVH